MTTRTGLCTVPVATCLLILLLGGVVACQSDWGDRELQARIIALETSAVSSAVLERSDSEPRAFPPALLQELLGRLGKLVPAHSIGKVGDWTVYCEIGIEAGTAEPLSVKLATRESLASRIIVIIRERKSDNPRMGFYEGEAVYNWLEQHDLCTGGASSGPRAK